MDSTELTEIDASVRAIVRRAYELGRSEALKRVVAVLSSDAPSPEHLALMAPEQADTPAPASLPNGAESPEKRPWWAWPVR